MLTFGTVVIGVEDVRRAEEFWCRALGYRRRADDDGTDATWCSLVPAEGAAGTGISLMRSETPVQDRPRLHLDLYADDQAAEVRRLLALGATEVDWELYEADADFLVLADPDGNRFCVIDHSPS